MKPEHVFAALDGAHGGAIEEGNVGGGTGMICPFVDIFIAFSTANTAASEVNTSSVATLGNDQLDDLFLATVQASKKGS